MPTDTPAATTTAQPTETPSDTPLAPPTDTPTATPAATPAGSVVGDGTPSSCTEAALGTALAAGGSITFNCGPSPVTITVTARKTVGVDTILDGGGLITLSGGSSVGVLMVAAGISATIENLGISDASDDRGEGGAIVNWGGALTASNITVAASHTQYLGGGILNNYGTLTVSNSTFTGNSAESAGGAITNYWGTATVSGSVFSGNYNSPGGGGGGGILSYGTLTVAASTFSGNTSDNVAGAIYSVGRLVVASSTFSANSGEEGGAIYKAQGPLTISKSTFTGNTSDTGGAVYLVPGANTPGIISGCTFAGNTASSSAGAINAWDGPLAISNSTFAANSAPNGSAIFHPATGGALSLINCTVSGNSGAGGALRTDGGVVGLGNSIVTGSLLGSNCSGAITDGGHNLDSDGSCGVGAATDPLLDPTGLADNGGPMRTIALLASSPAINAGDQSVCAAPPLNNVDQRGFVRPGVGATNCSIGAYEFNSSGPSSAVCGNNVVEPGEACDAGAGNSDTVPNACRTNCTLPRCGDDVADAGEQCDNGDLLGSGCWSTCAVETGFTCSGSPSVCTGICGDGMVIGGEQCDDGNLIDGDGCSSTCQRETGFNCDSPPMSPSVCTPNCGDGIVVGGEQCDDNNRADGDGCSSSCVIEAGFSCSGAPSVCAPVCGDGIVTGGEQCDDGNLIDGDGCDSNCTLTACGNGIVTSGEQCDDGNTADHDGCSSVCTVESGFSCSGGAPSVCGPLCGNGILDPGEQCDNGAANSNIQPDACRLDCTVARCGDHIVDSSEQCDGSQPSNSGITRVTPGGVVTAFAFPAGIDWPRDNHMSSGVVAGPDGNPWFTGAVAGHDPESPRVGRITPSGSVTMFPLPVGSSWDFESAITLGPDGNLWFTGTDDATSVNGVQNEPQIGRITPGGSVTMFALPSGSVWEFGGAITTGPDGNLWFTGLVNVNTLARAIGRITPSGSVTTFDVQAGSNWQAASGIAVGADGNLWFTGLTDNTIGANIGRMTPDGTLTTFYLGGGYWENGSGIALGAYGTLWFTGVEINTSHGQQIGIGRVASDGSLTLSPLPVPDGSRWEAGSGIALGSDGDVWFTGMGLGGLQPYSRDQIGRVAPSGTLTIPAPVPSANWAGGSGIALGPDGNLWLTDFAGGKAENSNTKPDACRLDCTLPRCGDGVVDSSEQCDDGNSDDTDACKNDCTFNVCGDGVIQTGVEQCDDGNLNNGDGCDANCTPTGCGNGVVTSGEQCDDGNLVDGDGCSSSCTVESGFFCNFNGPNQPSVCTPRCGDGIVTSGEPCDDGNYSSGDGCSPTCTVESGFSCNGSPSVCAPVCGDGLRRGSEQCDDGNLIGGDGCESNCTYTPVSQAVSAGGTVTTDLSASGATPGSPVQMSVTTPNAGTVSITAQLPSGPPPAGFEVVGLQFHITAPPGSVTSPLILVFRIDASILPVGVDPNSIDIFKDGALVGTCSGPGGVATPDPCIADRSLLGDGEVQITIRTSSASLWTIAMSLGAVCGNGVLETGEQCDDGNQVSGDTCPANCSYTASHAVIRGDRTNPRRDRAGCQVEWYVVNPNNPLDRFGLPNMKQVCPDQDPTCDFDPAPGQCRFEVVVCVNTDDPNLPACSNDGVAAAQLMPTRPRLSRSPGIVALAAANEAKIRAALAALLDPNNPAAAYSNQAPLSATQKNFCSAPVTIDVRTGPRLVDSLLGAETLRVLSLDQHSPRPQRRRSILSLRCGPTP